MVRVAWRGPSALNRYSFTAVGVLLEYLTDTPVAPLQRELVEVCLCVYVCVCVYMQAIRQCTVTLLLLIPTATNINTFCTYTPCDFRLMIHFALRLTAVC